MSAFDGLRRAYTEAFGDGQAIPTAEHALFPPLSAAAAPPPIGAQPVKA
ncbi:hypothetical protein [Sphingomonas sp. 32-62-10]